MLEELECADVITTIALDKLPDPKVNTGRVRREEYIKQQRNKRPFFPKDEYIKQQRERRGQDKDKHNIHKDCTCEACGYSTRELHKLLNNMHTGNPKECPFRGPKHNNDKQTRERLNQYNLKNKNDKRVDVSEERLNTPPQRPTILKTNHVNTDLNEDEESNQEEESQDDGYNTDVYADYEDDIENGIYEDEGMLPQPTTSSLKIDTLKKPIVNHGKIKEAQVNPSDNMNIISSFCLKQE